MWIILLGLFMSIVFNLILNYFQIPVIIGYIVTGIFIAYFFHFGHSEILSEIAEFGIVFLMFMIGLEFSFDRLRAMKQEVLVFGILQVVGVSLIFFILCHFLLGLSVVLSLVVGMSFSLSSTAIVLKYFDEKKQLGSVHGRSILGILIMQDIAVIPILIILALVSNKDLSLSSLILKTLISGALVLVILLLPGKRLTSRFLGWAARSKIDEIFMAVVLLVVLGSAALSSYFGFSMSLGAFCAGMIISKSRFKYRIESDLSHFRDIFLALFFIAVGMQVDLRFLFANFFNVILLLFFVMVIKTLFIYGILRFFRSEQSALKTALSLCQIGEFSFAIFVSAASANVFSTELYGGIFSYLQGRGIIHFSSEDVHQFLVLMVIFSMVATPFILKNLSIITDYFLRKSTKNPVFKEGDLEMHIPLLGHIVVAGYGSFGQQVVSDLKKQGVDYVAMEYDISRVELGEKNRDRVVFGNITQKGFLEKFRLNEARCLIVAIDDWASTRLICQTVLEIAPKLDIIVKVDSIPQEEDLKAFKISSINTYKEISKCLVEHALKEKNNE